MMGRNCATCRQNLYFFHNNLLEYFYRINTNTIVVCYNLENLIISLRRLIVEEKDCIILINIYKEQNLGRAAKKLYLTPPALTYRIQQLETRFSVPIIKRNGNQIFF